MEPFALTALRIRLVFSSFFVCLQFCLDLMDPFLGLERDLVTAQRDSETQVRRKVYVFAKPRFSHSTFLDVFEKSLVSPKDIWVE